MPSMDIIDRDKEVVIRAEMPGLEREDITVDVSDHMLTIRGERKRQTEEREEDYYRREIGTVAFARSLSLPEEVEADSAKAAYRDGVLEVTLPKKAPSERKTLQVE
jgi:HSP20 family protein